MENLSAKEKYEALRDPSNSNDIESIVKKVLKVANISRPPVDVFQIARDMGFSLLKAEFTNPEVAGMMGVGMPKTNILGESQFIVINKDGYLTRDRFTVAHEIGHNLLHIENTEQPRYFERIYQDSQALLSEGMDKAKEDQANQFAAALLMPEEFVKSKVSGPVEKVDLETIVEFLCKEFNVSTTVAERRLEELNLLKH